MVYHTGTAMIVPLLLILCSVGAAPTSVAAAPAPSSSVIASHEPVSGPARNADTSVRLPKWLIAAANATPARSSSGGSVATRGILYKGAPFPLRTLPVYYIWYGSWNDSAAMDILTNLASNIGACFKLDTCTADASLCRLASPRTSAWVCGRVGWELVYSAPQYIFTHAQCVLA